MDRKYQNVTEIESGFRERRKQLVAQLKECDEYLKQTASRKEVYKNLKVSKRKKPVDSGCCLTERPENP